MPNGWMHATIDLIAFGQDYFLLHQLKDRASRKLGSKHRVVDHDWYWAFGALWDFDNPFPDWLNLAVEQLAEIEGPDAAEKEQALLSHDYTDRTWDSLTPPERKYWEGFFLWLLLNPEILKGWAGVDVIGGRIKRLIDGQEMWESCPELKGKYARLRAYAEVVRKNDPELTEALKRLT